jgi:hypothetical protein
MSTEGVALVARTGLVIAAIIMTAIVRVIVGPGRRRNRIMQAGTVGGISFGVLVAYVVSPLLKTDASAVCAFLGIALGWAVSWLFARRIAREAH